MDATTREDLDWSIESLRHQETLNLLCLCVSILGFLACCVNSCDSVAVNIYQHPVPAKYLTILRGVLRLLYYPVFLLSSVALWFGRVDSKVAVPFFCRIRGYLLYQGIHVREVPRCGLICPNKAYFYEVIITLEYIPPSADG